jgi:hypothetical protein
MFSEPVWQNSMVGCIPAAQKITQPLWDNMASSIQKCPLFLLYQWAFVSNKFDFFLYRYYWYVLLKH